MLAGHQSMIQYLIRGDQMQPRFKKYASTNARLLSHLDRITEIKRIGRIRPITIEIAPTDKCNLDCSWCSVRDRPGDVLALTDIMQIIDKYVELGAKSIELTGGGDPLMHPYIGEIIDYAHKKTRAVGLITNGLLLPKFNVRRLTSKLMWMRISLSGLDFGSPKGYYAINPEEIKTFFGCSYLVATSHKRRFYQIRKDLEEKVLPVAEHLRAKYVRVIPDCNDSFQIDWLKRNGEDLVKDLPNLFVQAKDYRVPPVCYWRYMKPFVNSDGWVYQCSTCSLFERKFGEHWRVARIEDIEEIYDGYPTSFDTKKCLLCFFTHQNQVLGDLLTEVVHEEFV